MQPERVVENYRTRGGHLVFLWAHRDGRLSRGALPYRPSLRAPRSNPPLRQLVRHGLLRCARNDGGYGFAFSRRVAPEVCIIVLPSSKSRAQGRPGACCTRGLACDLRKQRLHTSIQVQAGASRPSLRNGFTAYYRALPGERLFCLRRPQEAFASPGLDASTAAPEPHDFTVRFRRARLSRHQRPSHPTARS